MRGDIRLIGGDPPQSPPTRENPVVGAQPPPIPYILGEGVNYLTLRVQFYDNECNEGRDAYP